MGMSVKNPILFSERFKIAEAVILLMQEKGISSTPFGVIGALSIMGALKRPSKKWMKKEGSK
jgi:hypothetical protein